MQICCFRDHGVQQGLAFQMRFEEVEPRLDHQDMAFCEHSIVGKRAEIIA